MGYSIAASWLRQLQRSIGAAKAGAHASSPGGLYRRFPSMSRPPCIVTHHILTVGRHISPLATPCRRQSSVCHTSCWRWTTRWKRWRSWRKHLASRAAPSAVVLAIVPHSAPSWRQRTRRLCATTKITLAAGASAARCKGCCCRYLALVSVEVWILEDVTACAPHTVWTGWLLLLLAILFGRVWMPAQQTVRFCTLHALSCCRS